MRLAAFLLLICVSLGAPAFGQQAPLVGIRVGNHPTYGRVVLDWPNPVTYRAEEAGDRLVLRFEAPARFDLSAALRLPKNVLSISAIESGVALQAPLGTRFRHYRLGNRVVIDVLDGNQAAAPAAQAAAGQAAAPPTPRRAAAPPPPPPAAPPASPAAAAAAPVPAAAGALLSESAATAVPPEAASQASPIAAASPGGAETPSPPPAAQAPAPAQAAPAPAVVAPPTRARTASLTSQRRDGRSPQAPNAQVAASVAGASAYGAAKDAVGGERMALTGTGYGSAAAQYAFEDEADTEDQAYASSPSQMG